MKSKFIIDKREPESKKRQLLEKVIKQLGTHVSIAGEEIEVERSNERKVVDLLTHSGLKYQKAA